jgi:hypothetical protein
MSSNSIKIFFHICWRGKQKDEEDGERGVEERETRIASCVILELIRSQSYAQQTQPAF